MHDNRAKEHIYKIRRNLFLSDHSQRERQNRSIWILTNELYSSFGRVLLEILQNADDSNFEDHKESDSKHDPRVYILLRWDSLVIHINEIGMTPQNIESVCDIGNSSKKNSDSRFFTGEKGIGYMSFFKITDKPGIYSGDYSIRFSSEPDDEIGLRYIVPKWEEENDFPDVVKAIHKNISNYGVPWIETVKSKSLSKGTIHFLPLGSNIKKKFPAILSAIHEMFVPDILLFLRNIKSIVIDVEPRKNSGFCSSDRDVMFPLLRRRLLVCEIISIQMISDFKDDSNLMSISNGDTDDFFSDIKGFKIVNLELKQFDEDDLDDSKSKLLKENSVSSSFMLVNWELELQEESQFLICNSSILRDRISRKLTNWSIALPLYHKNSKLDLASINKNDNLLNSTNSLSLGSSVFGKQRKLNGKLFCTFPLENKLYLPFHVNIQDLILTANRESYIIDNEWNKYILNKIFENRIVDFITCLVNSKYMYSEVMEAINDRYTHYIDNVLLEHKINDFHKLYGSNTQDYFPLGISELIKFSWIPEDSNDHNSILSEKLSNELYNKPLICRIDGSFCKFNEAYLNLQLSEFCSSTKYNSNDYCVVCKMHIKLLKYINFNIIPVLHPLFLCGHACMHYSDTKAIHLLRLIISQTFLSYNIKYINIFSVLISDRINNLLDEIDDDEILLLIYLYLCNEKEEDWVVRFEGLCHDLKIIPTRDNGRIKICDLETRKVFLPDESFKIYWKVNNYDEFREVINNIFPMDFFSEKVYNLADYKIRSFIDNVLKIELISVNSFYKWIIGEIDELIEKGWEYAINNDIQRVLLKITPLIIEDKNLIDSDCRILMKLPIVVQTYSPSFLKALMYNKDPPKTYANEDELLNKDKLAKCSFINAGQTICRDCKSKIQLEDGTPKLEEMVEPTSVSLRMSQVSKSLTSLLTLHSNWERSKKNILKKNIINHSKCGEKNNNELSNVNLNFEYKGLTIVPPLWPPVVEWVFSKVCDRFHFVEISPNYIVQNTSRKNQLDSTSQCFRSFINKFINLLEQWYIGCNFDRLPPKTDSTLLSWMTDENIYPLSSSSCFYCKHLIYIMRAGALIQITNEYLRRSYDSYFLDNVLPNYPWIPVSLKSRDYSYSSDVKSGEVNDPLLSKPSDLLVPDLELSRIPKYISPTMLNLLPVTLRNAYKLQLLPLLNEKNKIPNGFIYSRIEEDKEDELRQVIETLENLGVTTQISTLSLIKILRCIKEEFGNNDINSVNLVSNNDYTILSPLNEANVEHLIELASFGFGITKNKLLQSEWWNTLYKEWMFIRENKKIEDSNANRSAVDILSDIYQLIGQQSDFDISVDLKRIFYKDSLLYIPLMKSTIYNWVNIDYNTMIWSDPYDFFHGAFMIISKFIKKERIRGLMPFFLSLVSEQPTYQHYAYLWLKECPNLLSDVSSEGRIKFESFISVSINKFVGIYYKLNISKKLSWWQKFCDYGKVPIKGKFKFYNRQDCCVEDISIRNYKHEQFIIPLALTPNANSYFFYKEVFKLKTLTECYRIKYNIDKNESSSKNSTSRELLKLDNKLWLTLEFWGTLLLLLKYKSIDIYLSVLKILNERKEMSNSDAISHFNNTCLYCISKDDIACDLLNNSEYIPLEPISDYPNFVYTTTQNTSDTVKYTDNNNNNNVKDNNNNSSSGNNNDSNINTIIAGRDYDKVGEISLLIVDWLMVFMNTFEIEVNNIELEFELKDKGLNLPKKSKTTTSVLFKKIPNKKSSILFINKNMDKRDQLMDLYKLLIDPLQKSFEISKIIGIDIYELLILSTQQRIMFLLKHLPIFSTNNYDEYCDKIEIETIINMGLDFLELCSTRNCIKQESITDDKRSFIDSILYKSNPLIKNQVVNSRSSKLDDLIKGYIKSNLTTFMNSDLNENKHLSIEEINAKIGIWGEKISFEEILPNIISRKFILKTIEFELIEDYLSKNLILKNCVQDDCSMSMNDDNDNSILRDLISIQDMRIDSEQNSNAKQNNDLIKCKIKIFKETNTSNIKLIWLNSISESYLPFDFIIKREYISQGVGAPQNHIAGLIEVKTTKLPIWQFNISGSEIQTSRRMGDDVYRLLLIKDAGTAESQWLLIDKVNEFIKHNCKLINGLFEIDVSNYGEDNKYELAAGFIESN